MALPRIFSSTELFRERTDGTRRRRQPVPLPRLWPMIIGLFLALFAFPSLAQACGDFLLRVRGPNRARPGGLIVYTIKYQNLSWPLLTDAVLASHIPEHTSFVSASPTCQLYENTLVCFVGPLAQGEGGEVEVALRVDEDAPAEAVVKGKVVAVGREPGQKPRFLNHAWLWTKIVIPQLLVTKQSSSDIVYAGEQVTYTYTVTNTGDVALKDVTIVDDQKLPARVCDPVIRLEPGNTFACTWTTTLDADITNVATATGLDPWGDPVTDTASAFVNTVQRPGEDGGGIITLEKIANAEVVYADESVVYTYTVTNPSGDPVHDISLTDDQLGLIASSFNLEAGEGTTFVTSTVLITDTTNVATAMGQNLLGEPVTDTASAFVNTIQQPGPSGGGIITLEKVASAEVVHADESVIYTYTVTNPSSDPVHDISLTDDQLGLIASSFNLEAGESTTFVTSTVLVTDTTNVATAMGQNLLGEPVTDTASAFVRFVAPDIALSLSLTTSASRVYTGDIVTYTYIVSNTGSDIAYNIALSDDLVGTIASPFGLSGGESATYVASRALDEDTTSVATATGEDRLGKPLMATDNVLVDTIQRPGQNGEGIIVLTVTPSAATVEARTVVTYIYIVTNVSQDPVTDIVVTDDQFGFIAPLGGTVALDMPQGFMLQGGESRTLTISVPLYQTTRSTVKATGLDLLGTMVLTETTAFVEVFVALSQEYEIFLPIVSKNGP